MICMKNIHLFRWSAGMEIGPDEFGEKQRENWLLLTIYNIGIQRTLEIISENKENKP